MPILNPSSLNQDYYDKLEELNLQAVTTLDAVLQFLKDYYGTCQDIS